MSSKAKAEEEETPKESLAVPLLNVTVKVPPSKSVESPSDTVVVEEESKQSQNHFRKVILEPSRLAITGATLTLETDIVTLEASDISTPSFSVPSPSVI